ncbi:MAG: tRNA (adenosine(37)-N6)-threonylcarbamoyltransferase complex transferase subunit TsaD [Brachymonas sp.]
MLILGIESSCDETGVALVQVELSAPERSIPKLLGAALHSQIEMHRAYGGVVPELASRDHIRRLIPLTKQVLAGANYALGAIELIACTRGPGLAGALLVGSAAACALGSALGKPVLGVHHLEGHLLSPFLSEDPPEFPFIALLVSGGHTQLMRVDGVGEYALLGETIDDAAGEAFDKTAKLLGLPYPGGPLLAKLAARGDATAFKFPRPLLHSGDLDFSFAGLKTAVLTQVKRLVGDAPEGATVGGAGVESLAEQTLHDLAASIQAAITEVLVKKSLKAVQESGLRRLVVAGGVGANQSLRAQLNATCSKLGIRVHYPELHLCTDNGAMIALAAAMRVQTKTAQPSRDYAFDVKPRWPLDQIASA